MPRQPRCYAAGVPSHIILEVLIGRRVFSVKKITNFI